MACLHLIFGFFMAMLGNLKATFMETLMSIKKLAEDDPRRIIHSIKVGFTITIVSLLYYFRPLYNGFGQAGMWAVLTVVVAFEFTVGGTISKSLNRGAATLLAGALGIGASYLATLCGNEGKPTVLVILVFILAAASTFMRFFQNVKKKYDYGVLVFILTFTLVAVSGYRVTQILLMAHQRMSTILIGGALCIFISIFVCPVWAGQDLHNLVAGNLEKLAAYLEGFGSEIYGSPGENTSEVSSYLHAHKSVLNSKATEESLANFAWWEPGHGRFRFHHPWKQYLKIGALARECACHIETLNGCISSKPQVATDEFHLKIQSACSDLSIESGKCLTELAFATRTMTFPSPAAETHVRNSEAAVGHLKNILENCSPTNLKEILPTAVIASVLIDITKCVEKISVSVEELSQTARFQKPESEAPTDKQHGVVQPVDINNDNGNIDHVVIEIIEIKLEDSSDRNNNCCIEVDVPSGPIVQPSDANITHIHTGVCRSDAILHQVHNAPDVACM